MQTFTKITFIRSISASCVCYVFFCYSQNVEKRVRKGMRPLESLAEPPTRKVTRVRLSNGTFVSASIPGESHHLQQCSIILVRGARVRHLPRSRPTKVITRDQVSGVLVDLKHVLITVSECERLEEMTREDVGIKGRES